VKDILVIDDDLQLNRMICLILKDAGYEVRSAQNGQEGLGMFVKERPDLVITDLYMPEKEGLETIMELRQTDKEIKILVVSGGCPHMNMSEMFTMAGIFGADAALSKPFDIGVLLQKVREMLGE
jgi:two-component system, chemotaxis family, chemotaxis protein CheY